MRYLLVSILMFLSSCATYVPMQANLQIPELVLQETPTYSKVDQETMSEQDVLIYISGLYAIIDKITSHKSLLIQLIKSYNEVTNGKHN